MLFDLTFPCYLTTFSGKKCLSGKVICAFFCPAYRNSPVNISTSQTSHRLGRSWTVGSVRRDSTPKETSPNSQIWLQTDGKSYYHSRIIKKKPGGENMRKAYTYRIIPLLHVLPVKRVRQRKKLPILSFLPLKTVPPIKFRLYHGLLPDSGGAGGSKSHPTLRANKSHPCKLLEIDYSAEFFPSVRSRWASPMMYSLTHAGKLRGLPLHSP
jgi:hypothetical protein